MNDIIKNAERCRALFTWRGSADFDRVPVCQHQYCDNKDCREERGRYSFADTVDLVGGTDEDQLALSHVIRKADASADFAYKAVVEALDVIKDADEDDDVDAIRERLQENESPVYTSELTAWLNEDNRHVSYLGDAISEYGQLDGFQALAMAYSLAWREIAEKVLDVVASEKE